MTRKEFERWQQTRRAGRKSFVLMHGVLGYGLVMAVLMAVVLTLFNMVEGEGFNAHFLVRQLVINLLLFPFVGYGWGAWVWRYTEKQYHKEKERFGLSAGLS